MPLVRLFSLHHAGGGRLSLVSLEPLRGVLSAMGVHLDGLRFAAEDATEGAPMMTVEAQREDVIHHGAALGDLLHQAGVELDVLVQVLRDEEGGRHVS